MPAHNSGTQTFITYSKHSVHPHTTRDFDQRMPSTLQKLAKQLQAPRSSNLQKVAEFNLFICHQIKAAADFNFSVKQTISEIFKKFTQARYMYC